MNGIDICKPAVIRFAEFELDLRTAQLRVGGVLRKLQPQPAKVLGLLAVASGALVSREQIRREVWGEDRFVDFDKALNFCIRQIRTVLGDNAEHPRFVETLPRRGYRFLPPVEVMASDSRAMGSSAVRIGVKPFRNVDPSAEQDYFSEGLTEEIMTAVSRVSGNRIRVIARATMMQCQSKAMDLRSLRRELRVDYLLEGSVRRSSARVRIGVELIDVKDQTLVWAEIFEQRLTDLFSIQSEVARRVARSLAVELLPGSPAQQNASSISPEAHEAYLKGRYFWHKMTGQSVLAASRFFEEAIAICPNFGPAYAGLADCYAQMGSIRVALLSSAEALDKTKPLALQALQLDDGLSEAHNALALIRCWYELDWKGAAAEFRRALELDPDSTTHAHWHALLLVAIGEPEQALFEIQRGRDIDPLSPVLNTYAGAVQWFLGEYDLALRQLRYASQLDASYYRPYLFMGRTLWAMGQREEAFAMLCEAQKRAPENLETVAFSAAVDASMGRREAAIAAAGRVLEMAGNRFDPALLEAVIYTALGEYDTAFQCIERAINSRATPLYILRIDPAFRPLSADPRYRSCLLRIGLPA